MNHEEKILHLLEQVLAGQEKADKQFNKIDNRFEQIDNRLDRIEEQVGENTQILRALEHKTDVLKAEQDKLTYDVAEIKGDIKTVGKDISRVEINTAHNWADIAALKLSR